MNTIFEGQIKTFLKNGIDVDFTIVRENREKSPNMIMCQINGNEFVLYTQKSGIRYFSDDGIRKWARRMGLKTKTRLTLHN